MQQAQVKRHGQLIVTLFKIDVRWHSCHVPFLVGIVTNGWPLAGYLQTLVSSPAAAAPGASDLF